MKRSPAMFSRKSETLRKFKSAHLLPLFWDGGRHDDSRSDGLLSLSEMPPHGVPAHFHVISLDVIQL